LINYTIIIGVNDNNAIINNNYGRLKSLFWSPKFPRAQERISSRFIENLCTRPQKDSPVLHYEIIFHAASTVVRCHNWFHIFFDS